MTPTSPEELKVNDVVIITATTSIAQGFVGKMFKVLAVDYPYGVLLWLESVLQTRHTEDLRQFAFAKPSKEYVDAALPTEAWPDEIEA